MFYQKPMFVPDDMATLRCSDIRCDTFWYEDDEERVALDHLRNMDWRKWYVVTIQGDAATVLLSYTLDELHGMLVEDLLDLLAEDVYRYDTVRAVNDPALVYHVLWVRGAATHDSCDKCDRYANAHNKLLDTTLFHGAAALLRRLYREAIPGQDIHIGLKFDDTIDVIHMERILATIPPYFIDRATGHIYG